MKGGELGGWGWGGGWEVSERGKGRKSELSRQKASFKKEEQARGRKVTLSRKHNMRYTCKCELHETAASILTDSESSSTNPLPIHFPLCSLFPFHVFSSFLTVVKERCPARNRNSLT